jgi:hypothetical protein
VRIATTLEILRRGALGHDPETISRDLNIRGVRIITTKLAAAGWPDLEAVALARQELRDDYVEVKT